MIEEHFMRDAVEALAGPVQRGFDRGLHFVEVRLRPAAVGCGVFGRPDMLEQKAAGIVSCNACGEGKGDQSAGRRIYGQQDVLKLDGRSQGLIDGIHSSP